MIKLIELEHFKCFNSLVLSLKPLTLFSGTNSSGKTAVLQAIVLLQQTIREHEWSTKLVLNGSIIRLGTVADIVNEIHGREAFKISLMDENNKFSWEFSGERRGLSMEVVRLQVNDQIFDQPSELHYLLPLIHIDNSLAIRLRNLTYITAERIGPRDFYQLNDPQFTPVVGTTGEHAANILYFGRDEPVLPELLIDGVNHNRIKQIEARMNQFFPKFGLTVEPVANKKSLIVGLRTSKDTNHHSPIHAGFGLIQVFPIIVAILSAKQEDIVIIENPEAHLHPSGQAAMGQFLAQAAAVGIQIILESHSDHVLNGIRRSVKSGKISPENVAFYFFRPRSESEKKDRPQPQVSHLAVDRNGNLDDWPSGFFDQFDKDMFYFAGWS